MAGKLGSRRYSTTNVSENCRNGGNELSNARSFIILRSREGLTSFNIDNAAIFSKEKKYNEAFRGVYFLRIREKTFKLKPL